MALFTQDNVDQHVEVVSQQLVQAVETILNQNSSAEQRRQATQFCEDFKNNSIYLSNCGMHLCNTSSSPVIKHFGLQLVQHAIKFKWNIIGVEEKANLKLIALQFVAMGSGHVLEEPAYVKDSIAKLIIEIMKREWPQNWPDVFQNLSDISLKGESQLYIVLRILLRLAEEVTTMDGDLPPTRRKEMTTALSNILEELFKFFIKTLQVNFNKMKEMKTLFGNGEQKEVVLTKVLCECVLSTLCGYVGWVHTKYLVQDNKILLELLFLLLQEDDLKMMAAECLEMIVGRKGKVAERKPLLIFFNVDAIRIMFNSATSAVHSKLNDEKTITFLKRVCNVLSLLGSQQLASIWGSDCDEEGEPVHFNIYVEALMSFYQEGNMNMLITDAINKVWIAFLRNQDIAKNTTFRSFTPRILEASKLKLTRASHPLNKELAQPFYSETDFGSFAEKQNLWTTVRANTREIIQEITSLFPKDTFLQAATWLLQRLESTTQYTARVPVTETSEEYFQWESMTYFLHSVLTRLFSNESTSAKDLMLSQVTMENTSMNISQLGKKCIESLVNFHKEDLLIMTLVITCLESLLPFLEYTRDLLLPVIHKIFNAISFVSPHTEPSDNNGNALDFRRHAGAIWIRLCLTHKKLLIDIIDELTKHIQGLSARDDFNSQERALLTEGLAIISNGYMNYQKQNVYLHEILSPIKDLWMTSEVEQALSSSESLVSFIGLDRADEENLQCQKNRFHLQICLRFIHAVLKRVEPPKDSQDQINGGFKQKPDEEPLNPLTSSILPLLSNFFHLIRVLNNIWHPDILPKISPLYQPALEIHDSEKAAIFGLEGSDEKVKINQEEKANSSVYKMSTFLFKISEICALILSDSARLGQGLYSIPLIGQHLVDYVILSWKHLPNYRLRVLVRNFLKYYCRMCPPSYYNSAVVPVISSAFTLIIERLNKEWEKVRSRENFSSLSQVNPADDDDVPNDDKSSEVIEDQLVHLMTKNFMETFFAICTLARPTCTSATEESAEETGTDVKQPNPDDILQELAKYLLKNTETCQLILFTPFIALQWPDSSSFVKASKLCIPFIKQVTKFPPSGVAMQSSMFEQLYTMLLKSLQLMGHNLEMQSQTLRNAVFMYDTLRPLFPQLKTILLQVPNAKEDTINEYDKSLFSDVVMSEKQKKKIFKNILGGLIRKEVGKMFENDINILNLPPLPEMKKPSSRVEEEIGLTKLFEPSNNS